MLVIVIVEAIGRALEKRGAHVSFHKVSALWWTNGGLRDWEC